MAQDVSGKYEAKKNLPEKKFRAGLVTATIWKNKREDEEGNEVTYKTVTFERSYKDDEDNWRSTNSLRINDLPKAILVLEKAYEHLALSKGEDDEVQIELHQE